LIKRAGGYVIAQDPQTASIASMPEAIIKANLVNEILRPEDIITCIKKLVT